MRIDEACSLASEERGESRVSRPCRFLARQPILNARNEIIGYELLFRTGWENWFAGEGNGDRENAIRKTLDLCLYTGVESITNNTLAFVKCTRESVVGKFVTVLPPKSTVIEIPAGVAADGELMQACVDLRKLGYQLALDDFAPRADVEPLMEIADFVKVDFRTSDAYTRRQIHRMVRTSGASLIAEKLEDQREFKAARAEGYRYFQGYFFCHPEILSNREIPTHRTTYVRLLAELVRKPLDLDFVLHLVELEASLCYRLLRLANSPLWGVWSEITSVRGAFMLVGEERFRAMVSVAASCVLSEDQSPALISLSLERARFCELIAPLVNESPSEQFLLGLLSVLDAMLEASMESIVKSLPLRLEAKAALLGATNPAAIPLSLSRSFESESLESCALAAADFGTSEEKLSELYVDSVRWAADTLSSSR